MDYKNGKIYSIRSHQTDKVYFGSTCSPLAKRLYEHKNKYKLFLNGKYHYNSSFEILKYDDVYIELVEDFPCENKNQLFKREGEIIRGGGCVNKNIAGRTRTNKEYYDDNKEQISQKKKDYYEQNKEKLNEKVKCECGCEVIKRSLKTHLSSKTHLNKNPLE